MENGNYSLADIAAASNENGFGGNGLLYILLFAMIFGWGGNGFGGNNGTAARAEDIQRAVDMNGLQQSIGAVGTDVQRAIYEINNNTQHSAYDNLGEIRDVQAAVATGNANIINNLTGLQSTIQNCCCTTQRSIDSVNYNLATQSAAIQANDTANTQKVLDAIAQSKIETLTAKVNELEMKNAMCGVVRYPSATTYNAGSSCFGGCGCGSI